LERREPPEVRHLPARWDGLALWPEDAVEPAVAQAQVGVVARIGRADEGALESAERDRLLLLGPSYRIRLAGDLPLEALGGGEQIEPLGVELRRLRPFELPELVAVPVGVEHGEAGLRRPQRHLLALEGHARGDERVLQRVLPLGELRRDDAALARLAQPVEPLPLLALGGVLRLAEHLDLRMREQVRVARDDRRLLGDLLLPHTNRAALFGALVVVVVQACLVLLRRADGGRGHATSLVDGELLDRPKQLVDRERLAQI